MSHVLHVFMHGKSVGRVWFDAREERFGFEYSPAWTGSRNAFALSPAIPLGADTIRPGAVHRYLDNLLPEGRALDVAASLNQVAKSNTFGLMHALGKEPAGAFSFLALDASDDVAAGIAREQVLEPVRRVLSQEELSERIRERNTMPFPVWDGKVQLSLAGYQDKLQVLAEGEQLSLVDGSLSSTHLLKPGSLNPHMPCLVANEHFCMSLAARMGLPAAPVQIRRIPEPILLIERFDRSIMWDADKRGHIHAVRRLHVIDACQALDLPPAFKYERNLGIGKDVRDIREGASFERLFGLLPQMVTPATARLFLVRWAILQLLLGNGDAHGKNISFFVQPAGLVPTPLYDLVSTAIYGDPAAGEMAMAYGDAFRLEDVTASALARFALQTNTPPTQLAREITRMADLALKQAPVQAGSEVYVDEERDHVRAISDLVSAQADRLRALAPEIRKANAALA